MSQRRFNHGLNIAILDVVGDDVDQRVHHLEAPDGAEFPHIVHAIVTDQPVRMFDDDLDVDMTVQIDLYGDDDDGMDALQAINEKLFDGLNRKSLTVQGYRYAEAFCTERGEEIEDDDVLRIRTEYRIMASKAPQP